MEKLNFVYSIFLNEFLVFFLLFPFGYWWRLLYSNWNISAIFFIVFDLIALTSKSCNDVHTVFNVILFILSIQIIFRSNKTLLIKLCCKQKHTRQNSMRDPHWSVCWLFVIAHNTQMFEIFSILIEMNNEPIEINSNNANNSKHKLNFKSMTMNVLISGRLIWFNQFEL